MKRLSLLAKVVCVSFFFSAPCFADADPSSQSIQYDGSQADYSFNLKNEVSQTIYESKEVPDTCYRTVPDGTETQCHIETNQVCGPDTIKHVCENTTRQECTPVTKQECGPVTHQQCTTVEQNQCHTENRQVCTPTSHQECTSHEVCRPVGHSQQCTPEQECHTVTGQDCRDVPEQVCGEVPVQECHEVTQNECHNVTDNVCHDVPETVCHDDHIPNCQTVSKNVCVEVPKTRQEPYACTKTIQVPVGTELISSDTASVALHFDPTAALAGQKAPEQFVCSLGDGQVSLQLDKDTTPAVLLFEQLAQKSVSIDDKHRQITASISVRGVQLEDAELPLTGGVENLTLTESSVSFSLAKISAPELLKLAVAITRASDGSSVLAQTAVDLSKATLSNTTDGRTQIAIDLSLLGLASGAVSPGEYVLEITGTIAAVDGSGLLNPGILSNIPALSNSSNVIVPAGLNEIAPITANGIQSLNFDADGMSFQLGLLEQTDYVTVHLKIQKDILWGLFHDTKIDADLTADQLSVDISNGVSKVLAYVPFDVDSGTYEVTVTVTPNANVLSALLSPDQISQLKTATVEQKFSL